MESYIQVCEEHLPPGEAFENNTIQLDAKPGDFLFFHSASVPQPLYEEFIGGSRKHVIHNNLKNCKFVMHVLYYHYSRQLGSSTFRYVLKRRRIVIGNSKVNDLTDGTDVVNPLIVKAMRTRGKYLLIDGYDFDEGVMQKSGGFLNKKFWAANIIWGVENSAEANFARTVKLVKARASVIDVAEMYKAKQSKVKKQKKEKIEDEIINEAAG